MEVSAECTTNACGSNRTDNNELTEPLSPQCDEGRKITIALDTSQRSRDAFAWTVANMYRPGDKLFLIHVTPRPDLSTTCVVGGSVPPHLIVAENDKVTASKMLLSYSNYCVANGIKHEAKHCVGDLQVILQETTARNGSCALVVGNHNKSATQRFVLGSDSEAVVHASHVPVVVVKHPHRVSLHHDVKRKIGVCVDTSEEARTAFEWTINNLHRSDDVIFILHTSLAGILEPDKMLEDAAAWCGDGLMDEYAGRCVEKGLDYHVIHSRSHKSLSDGMASLADSLGLDCLVVGSRGQGAIKRCLFGSFSDGVVRTCKCNIVIGKQ